MAMRIDLHFGTGVLCLPAAVSEHLPRADETALRVLLALAAGLRDEGELADTCGCGTAAVERALAFWQGTGLISLTEEAPRTKTAKRPAAKERPAKAASALPAAVQVDSAAAVAPAAAGIHHYDTEELVHLLETRRELAALVDECSRIFGKVFSSHETSILLSLLDYLNVEGDYLLILLSYCAGIGKRSMRYVEKTAMALYDEGITSPDVLQSTLQARQQKDSLQGSIRTLFGAQGRSLSAKERRLMDTWIDQYRFGLDIIQKAYDMTVDAIGKSSFPYANSILERWAAADLHTLADIEAAEAARTAAGTASAAPGNSFDTNDFFDAALKRSFGEDYQPADKKVK